MLNPLQCDYPFYDFGQQLSPAPLGMYLIAFFTYSEVPSFTSVMSSYFCYSLLPLPPKFRSHLLTSLRHVVTKFHLCGGNTV
jgi:hypothetical protein